MAYAPLLRQHVLPLAGLTAALTLYPKTSVFAEEVPNPVKTIRARKPIYDEASTPSVREIAATTPAPPSGKVPTPSPSDESNSLPKTIKDAIIEPRKPTPTDRLASQIKQTRLFLHSYAAKAEDSVNRGMDQVLSAEKSFTGTIASLAPPKDSNEKLVPGAIYVLVAAMAGSILVRNRNILLRAVTPLITGATAAHYVVPRTTKNVEDLIWEYEKKFPVISDNHIKIQERVRHFIETGKAHGQMGLAMAEEKVQGVRESVQDWVKQGR